MPTSGNEGNAIRKAIGARGWPRALSSAARAVRRKSSGNGWNSGAYSSAPQVAPNLGHPKARSERLVPDLTEVTAATLIEQGAAVQCQGPSVKRGRLADGHVG